MNGKPSWLWIALVCGLLFCLSACTAYAGSGTGLTRVGRSPTPRPTVTAPPLPTLAPTPEPTPEPAEKPASSGDALEPTAEKPDHYLSENESRYQAFQKANDDIPYPLALAYVNAAVDIPHYAHTVMAENPDDILVLCNKTYRLSSRYAPKNLVSLKSAKSVKMQAEAAQSFDAMHAAMLEEGLRVYPISGYRSYLTQKSIYARNAKRHGVSGADTYSARPGHSEHQTGLAIDMLQRTGDSSLSYAKFEKTKQYAWLVKNAHRYGFILRYPDGYRDITGYKYEPWHWRYVGVEAATRMKEESIVTWEEYVGRYLSPLPAVEG